MWRGGYEEDWERRKEYLIRSLFKDIPLLSPVPEEESSRSESAIQVSPSSYKTRRPLDVEHGPWSPLPPLIVEKEPNRHDEPEEYYQLLEQKMKRLHKKIFIENRSLSNSIYEYGTDESTEKLSSGEALHKTYAIEEREELNKSLCTSASSSVNETGPLNSHSSDRSKYENSIKTIDSSKRSNEENNSELSQSFNDDESIQIPVEIGSQLLATADQINKTGASEHNGGLFTSSSSSVPSDVGGYYQQVTFKAQIHREAFVEDEMKLSLVYEDPVHEKCTEKQFYDELAHLERNIVSDLPIQKTKGTSSEHSDVEDIEVMRNPQDHCIRTSYGISQEQSQQEGSENLTPKFAIHLLEDCNSFDALRARSNSTEVEQCSDHFDRILQSSTPKISKKRRSNDENISDYTYSSTSNKKRQRYENAAVQVNAMTEWNQLWANFFKGTPKTFRLCSCKNHRCLC